MRSYKGKLIGSFGKKIIKYNWSTPDRIANNSIFLFHGAFSSGINSSKIDYLVKEFVKNGFNTLSYETSRMFAYPPKTKWPDYVASFEGKGFNDELEDVRRVITFALADKCSRGKIDFVGFSLGGTISSYFIRKVGKRLNSVQLFGSGVTTKGIDQPILSTYPESKEVLNNFHDYPGKLLLVQGSNDQVVPIKKAREIILQSKKAKIAELHLLKGVDHTFKYINDREESSKMNNYLASTIISFSKLGINCDEY